MKKLILVTYANFIDLLVRVSLFSDTTLKLRYAPGFNKLRYFNGRARAYKQFVHARERVPAYGKFLDDANFVSIRGKGLKADISCIPVTNKKNYINAFSIDERCVGGKIPIKGVVIDESSGSSGIPTNWVRGERERMVNHRLIEFGITNLLGKGPIFIINAFALGAWATGMNITMSCLKFSKVKSTGPDLAKIINTLKQFGTQHTYLVMGYPPFLKRLVDTADIDWQAYNVTLIFGGEPMTEGMRDYLLNKGIKKIYSSFGASDLELNIAHENDFTISLRRLLREDHDLKKRVLKYGGALPMVFQFNPADFWIECSEEGELIFTICRPDYTSPKIRYNIFDKGHVMQMKELKEVLKEFKLSDKITLPQTDLPILFHYGRGDMTVSFFGSNISPNDIQEVIFMIPALAGSTNSFYLETIEDSQSDKQLIVSIEMAENVDTDNFEDNAPLCTDFFIQLEKINQDFKAAHAMAFDNRPILKFYKYDSGKFANSDIRIKTKYIRTA